MLSLLLLFASVAEAQPQRHSKEPRTVMVQLFEWPWNAVAEECERVLGPAGFAAVQVSPPTEHVRLSKGPWWERYQPVSHRLHSRSGSEPEFAEMVRRCRRVGVDVYADVILNHMSAENEGVGFAGSRFQQYEYPGLFSRGDFHNCGRNGNNDIKDFQDLFELQYCELLNLPDLATGAPPVQEKLASLLRRLLDLGVAGFRVDAAKHMPAADIGQIFSRVGRSFYAVHELIVTPGEPVRSEPYLEFGDTNVFPYAYGLGAAFRAGDLSGLPELPSRMGVGSNEAVVFLENHDLERRPPEESLLTHVRDPALHRLGLVFLLTYPYGYPQLYSGYRFANYDEGPPVSRKGYSSSPGAGCAAPWTCAHREPHTLALVNFRNRTDAYFQATDLVRPARGVLAFGRGNLGHVAINVSLEPVNLSLKTRLQPGTHCNVLPEGGCATVDKGGKMVLRLPAQSAFVTF